MLDIIKHKIANIVMTCGTTEGMSAELRKVVEEIEKVQSEEANATDLHRTFRTLEKYSSMYKIAVDEYLAISTKELERRSFQLQEILSLLTLITSLIASTLRKYNTSEDKGALGRYIRTLNNNLEQYKADKISWTTMLKAITTMIEERIVKTKEHIQELIVKTED